VINRACQLMKEHNTDIVSEYGGIDLSIIQKYINFHYSVSLDLFGSELSTNAATYYSAGLKGRFKETDRDDDHQLKGSSYPVLRVDSEKIIQTEHPALNALNETLRDSYIADCERALARWNKIIREVGISFELKLPHRGFRRSIGEFAGVNVTVDGHIVSEAEWNRRQSEWLPTQADREFVASLMKPVTAPGQFASWIAAPVRGINHQALDFEYVTAIPAN
jgi:benzoyl-CoA 2,3-dioxygenase component B